MNKTPITIVAEFCAKNRLTPEYELVYTREGTNDPLFRYKLRVCSQNGYVETFGEGRSKKEAKHAAANKAANRLLEETKLQTEVFMKCDSSGSGEGEYMDCDDKPNNYVGELTDFCRRIYLPEPEYTLTGEQGPPHLKDFFYSVKVGSYKEQASSSKKQLAKHMVARNMLDRLKQAFSNNELLPKVKVHPDKSEKAKTAFVGFKAKKSGMCRAIDKEMRNHNVDCTSTLDFSEEFVNLLKGYNKTLSDTSNPIELLYKHFNNNDKVKLQYYFVPSSHENVKLCFCEISSYPFFVTNGFGPSEIIAKTGAAHNMVNCIKKFI